MVNLDELTQPWGCTWMRMKNQRGTFPTKDRTFILRDQKKGGAQRLNEECAQERKYINEQDPKFLHFLEANQNKKNFLKHSNFSSAFVRRCPRSAPAIHYRCRYLGSFITHTHVNFYWLPLANSYSEISK